MTLIHKPSATPLPLYCRNKEKIAYGLTGRQAKGLVHESGCGVDCCSIIGMTRYCM